MALILETKFDTVPEMKKPESGNPGLISSAKNIETGMSMNLAEPEIFYNPESAMTNKIYLQYIIPSTKAQWLRENYPNAFLLLSVIAERARRTLDHVDGLQIGDAIIGDHKAAGLTRQNYRTALQKLVEFNMIEIIYNGKSFLKREKSTIKSTIKGTLVNLLDSEIWNINPDLTNHDSNQRSTNSQPTLPGENFLPSSSPFPFPLSPSPSTLSPIPISLSPSSPIRRTKKKEEEYIAPTEQVRRHKKVDSIIFSFEEKKFNGIQEGDFVNWGIAYPGVDFSQELAKACEWLLSNPTKAKTNWRKFLTNWFTRAADRKLNFSAANSQKQSASQEANWETENRNKFFSWKKENPKVLGHMEYKNGYVINSRNGKELSVKMMPEVFESHFVSIAGVRNG